MCVCVCVSMCVCQYVCACVRQCMRARAACVSACMCVRDAETFGRKKQQQNVNMQCSPQNESALIWTAAMRATSMFHQLCESMSQDDFHKEQLLKSVDSLIAHCVPFLVFLRCRH